MYKGIGWVRGEGFFDKLKVGHPCHFCTYSGAVFSVGDRDVQNPQDTLRQTLAATCHPIHRP